MNVGILDGNPKKEPLHYGEVFHLWQASMMAKGLVSCYQTYLNHIGDKDLTDIVRDLADQARQEEQECDKLLVAQEIVPPPGLPEKPKARLEDIPVGARFSDMEITSAISADMAAGLAACSAGIGMSIREDVAALFAKHHAAKAALGLRILRLNKNKGWLVPPPLHMEKAELVKA